MADFPLSSGHTEAISKIISSVIPPKTYSYLYPFLPGLYFQISIFLGNPDLIHQLILRSNQAASLGTYLKSSITVFLAFILGLAFILWVGTIHRTLSAVYRVSRFLWRQVCKWPLLPVLNRLLTAKATVPLFGLWSWLSGRPWFVRKVLLPVQRVASGVDDDSEGARRLWTRLSRHLFKKNYDFELHDLSQDELNALYSVYRSIPVIQLPDHMLMVATQALGWAGLAAVRFAPSLANKNYVIFNLFLIAVGLLYDWWLIRGQSHEETYAFLKVRALLLEMRKGGRIKKSAGNGSLHPE